MTSHLDIAANLDLQEQCEQRMRRLAGGLSHEFNNALASIQGFAEIAASLDPDVTGMLGRTLHNILRGCDQARECIGRARIMGGRVDCQAEEHDLAALVAEWCKERNSLLPPDVQLGVNRVSGLPSVAVDSALLELAFDEILQNSLWAVNGRGEIQVSVLAGMASRWPVMLEIEDSGIGMPSETVQFCCEPYYTTRDAAGAKGRGLSIVQGIVWAHGGRLVVESVSGRGTVVQIWLPRRAS